MDNEPVRRRRPFSVTLLSLGVLSIGVLSLIRFIEAIRQWSFLEGLPGVSPLYIAATGFIWTAVWAGTAAGLWFGLRWAPKAVLLAALFYALYFWFDLIFVGRVSLALDSGSAWPFRLLLTILLVAFTFYLSFNRKARAYFMRQA
jgi:hypothetical protein